MIRALFICGKARARSPTAAQVFSAWDGVSTDFGGISDDADDVLSADQLDWANAIFVMEQRHARRLSDSFAHVLQGKTVVNLSVRDKYTFMQDELIQVLIDKAGPHLSQGKRR